MPYTIAREVNQEGNIINVFSDYKKRVPLNSISNSVSEMDQFLYPHREQVKVMIVLGIGNGEIVKNFINNPSKIIHMIIIEPYSEVVIGDEIKAMLVHANHITVLQSKDREVPILDFQSILAKFIGVDIELHIHPNYEKTDLDFLKEVISQLKNGLRILKMNQNTQQLFQKDWLIEPLLNLKYSYSLSLFEEFKDKFKGQRGVLVSAGPSASKLIPEIKELQKGAHVFAVGSVMKLLLKNDITPDFVTSFDSADINYEAHFKEYSYNGKLIVGSIVNSNILKYHTGDAILVPESVEGITSKARPDLNTFYSGPSVAVFTLQVMYYLGFSEIYLIGQDLALENNQYYADEAAEGEFVDKNNKNIDLYIDNNAGGKSGTTYPLYSFLQSFNQLVKLFDLNKVRVYNLAKYGAKIDHVPYISYEEIKVRTQREEVALNLNPKVVTSEALNEISIIVKELDELHNELRRIKAQLVRFSKNDYISDGKLIEMLEMLKAIRSMPILEDVILNQISFIVNRINNVFEFLLDKEQYTNEDKKYIFIEFFKLIQIIIEHVELIMNDTKFMELRKELKNEVHS
ncbi:motility associated factor glycosyltransferase family protein [Pontibacillus litoralis]|nr:6-hydroxymethylpterin diphosphokinase MptE-like protein [Pontibacillus litoralis]